MVAHGVTTVTSRCSDRERSRTIVPAVSPAPTTNTLRAESGSPSAVRRQKSPVLRTRSPSVDTTPVVGPGPETTSPQPCTVVRPPAAVDIQSPTAVDEFGALHLSGDSPEAHPVCSPFQVVGPFPMARLGPSTVDPARVCAPVEPGQCATAASPLGSGREPVGVRRLHGRPFRTAAAGHQVQHSALGRRRVGGSPSADGEVWTDTRAATSSARATAAAVSSPTVTGARVWPCSTRGRHITHRTPVEVRDLLPAPP